jgi:hypothetical protein
MRRWHCCSAQIYIANNRGRQLRQLVPQLSRFLYTNFLGVAFAEAREVDQGIMRVHHA